MQSSDWTKLHSSRATESDGLLVRHNFGPDGYRIQVTDLSSVWTEQLTEKQIVERAEASECSIDPSEDQGQYPILLRHLEDALNLGNEAELRVLRRDRDARILIQTTSPLPRPLDPLAWTFHLERATDEALRSEVIMPLVGLSFVQKQQIEELSQLISDKDGLIQKILDKIESLGLDLSAVIPLVGLVKGSKQTNYREKAAKHVKGLAIFEEHKWKQDFSGKVQLPDSLARLIRDGFSGGDGESARKVLIAADERDVKFGARPAGSQSAAHSQNESQMSGFQRQQTPPHIVSASRHPPTQPDSSRLKKSESPSQQELPLLPPADDESTTDEGENTDMQQRVAMRLAETENSSPSKQPEPVTTSHSTRSSPGRSAAPRRLGKIGAPAQPPNQSGVDGAGASSQLSKSASIAPPKGRRLGRIGRANADESEASAKAEGTDQISSGAEESAKSLNPARGGEEAGKHHDCSQASPRRLGRIGGSSKNGGEGSQSMGKTDIDSSPPHDQVMEDESSQALPPSNVEATPSPKRTEEAAPTAAAPASSQDKADRKREELKHQLEQRNKTQPKKKRKF